MISQLPRLEYLDDTIVNREEKEQALKIYDRRRTTSTLNRGGVAGGEATRGGSSVVSEERERIREGGHMVAIGW